MQGRGVKEEMAVGDGGCSCEKDLRSVGRELKDKMKNYGKIDQKFKLEGEWRKGDSDGRRSLHTYNLFLYISN